MRGAFFRYLVFTFVQTAFAVSSNLALQPRDVACTTPTGNGTCISISSCDGTSVPGFCPSGGSDVECCVRTCKTPLGPGFCEYAQYNNCTGGSFVAGYCPGDESMQCCVSTCVTPSGNGSCLWTGSYCENSFVAGMCPGTHDIECCPGGKGKGNGTITTSTGTANHTTSARTSKTSSSVATTKTPPTNSSATNGTTKPSPTLPQVTITSSQGVSLRGNIGTTLGGFVFFAVLAGAAWCL